MSRIQRAVEKADREGLLTWTRPSDERDRRPTAVEDPPVAAPPLAPAGWELPGFPGEPPTLAEIGLSPLFVAATEPTSSAAEQFRLLRTRLEARAPAGHAQVVLVTSPRTGDGKTTTSANLALTIAQDFQRKVVLVEADLRRPMLSTLFGVRSEPGLVDVLAGAASLEDALVPVPDQRLLLLPAGVSVGRSAELLSSSMMRRVLDTLRQRFDRIVVDTPPVVVADTLVLARLADGLLIVVRAGMTPRPAMERALAAVDRQRLIGVVLNEVDETPGDYAYPGARLSEE